MLGFSGSLIRSIFSRRLVPSRFPARCFDDLTGMLFQWHTQTPYRSSRHYSPTQRCFFWAAGFTEYLSVRPPVGCWRCHPTARAQDCSGGCPNSKRRKGGRPSSDFSHRPAWAPRFYHPQNKATSHYVSYQPATYFRTHLFSPKSDPHPQFQTSHIVPSAG